MRNSEEAYNPGKRGARRSTFVTDAKSEFCRSWKHYLDSKILIKAIIVDEKLNDHINPTIHTWKNGKENIKYIIQNTSLL